MSKKKSKKKNKDTNRMTGWDKAKLFGTIVVIIWLGLAANGVELSDGAVVEDGLVVEDIALASMLPSLPSLKVTKPGGVAVAPPKAKEHVVGVVGPIRSIPDDRGNYRAASPSAETLRGFFVGKSGYKMMNLSGDVPGRIDIKLLRAICEEYGVEYLTSGELDRFAARSGYQEGRGFVRSAAAAARYLAGGKVLVVDRSGNRAGAMIGYHLAQLGFSRELIIGHNNWEAFAADPGLNLRYLETGVGNLRDE
jgi:hypothetical protein